MLARRSRIQSGSSLLCIALALTIGLIAILQPISGNSQRFAPARRSSPLLDLLSWIPATDDSVRSYAAWVEAPGAPITLREAVEGLGLDPGPLALGRSGDWQHITAISSSQITGWTAAPGAGVTILAGSFDADVLASNLRARSFAEETWRSVPIFINPHPQSEARSIAGDDARSLNAVAIASNHVVLGIDRDSVQAALEAAVNDRPSLAGVPTAMRIAASDGAVGFMVGDLRDLAIPCGVSNGWRVSDFDTASGRSVVITYGADADGANPHTDVWVEFGNDDQALAAVAHYTQQWESGFISQNGMGEAVNHFATVGTVSQRGPFVVADLIRGRENGWVRSGVRFLIAICEDAASLVPAEPPLVASPAATPVARESP